MRNMWRVFCDDMRRIVGNVATAVIVLGLVFLPSIFSWYNVLACWDVFGNTGNLTVAVANTDEGYESDLMPIRVNIGDSVISALRANDQLNWVFTTEEDAIDGARAGRYYAAVVIPPSFSQDMMTFYSADSEHAQIVYYTNEKKSAVAPKVTDQGADRVAYQVNETFAQTLGDVSLSVMSGLSKYLDEADAESAIGDLANRASSMGSQMGHAASVVRSYSGMLSSAQSLVSGSSQLLTQAREHADEVNSIMAQDDAALASLESSIRQSAADLDQALAGSTGGYDGLIGSVDSAFSSAQALTADSIALVEAQEHLGALSRDAAGEMRADDAEAQALYSSAADLAQRARASLNGVGADYNQDIGPKLSELSQEAAALASSVSDGADKINGAASELGGSADSVASTLASAQAKLDAAADRLQASADELNALSATMLEALSSGDTQKLRDLLATDTTALATALAAPVQIDREPVFPAENFGSQMAPLYTTLAIWVGSLLLLVALKTKVPESTVRKLRNPRPHQLFLGRFGVFAVVSLLQTTCMALGNLLFLGIQAVHPFLYLLCFWFSGLVCTFFIYSLVVSFANLGKGIAVLLLILQVTSGGGSFPLQLLPDFFQALSPYVPATHIINAMRAAMMGIYQNDFWIEMGELALFIVPAALLGLVLRKPLERFLSWYVEQVEASKLAA